MTEREVDLITKIQEIKKNLKSNVDIDSTMLTSKELVKIEKEFKELRQKVIQLEPRKPLRDFKNGMSQEKKLKIRLFEDVEELIIQVKHNHDKISYFVFIRKDPGLAFKLIQGREREMYQKVADEHCKMENDKISINDVKNESVALSEDEYMQWSLSWRVT